MLGTLWYIVHARCCLKLLFEAAAILELGISVIAYLDSLSLVFFVKMTLR